MKRFDQINVIPFVDIMLVLLAIVLTTATFVVQGKIRVDLPEARHGENATEKPPHRLVVSADGALHLDDEPLDLSRLDAALAQYAKDTAIRVSVDRQSPFEHFVGVLDLLRKHELKTLDIETQAPR
ncbi:MAG: biopolymer transporter ExbD [Halothiobacillaceae bacterium]|jgi:biopolymer transport protein ExbD|nr:biopolymer transporter ExbD [Halothiobacillaceae bacterium]